LVSTGPADSNPRLNLDLERAPKVPTSVAPLVPGKWYVSKSAATGSPMRRLGPYNTRREAEDVAQAIAAETLKPLLQVWRCRADQEAGTELKPLS